MLVSQAMSIYTHAHM